MKSIFFRRRKAFAGLGLVIVLLLMLISAVGCRSSPTTQLGPISHPVYYVILENQTDQVLNIYKSGYFLGQVEPRRTINTMWDTHSAFIEIEAKSLSGELVFSDTYSSRNLEKIEAYKGVIPPLQSK